MRLKQPIAFVLVTMFLLVATAFSSATYTNPVIDQPFPDPSILKVGSLYYAYATNTDPDMSAPRYNMLCARSTDLVHWTMLDDALPRLPVWAKPGRTWAPEVRALPGGAGYVAYFTAWDAATDQQAVGIATSPTPDGPFTSPSLSPLIGQPTEGGAIDPSCFLDPDGSRYLV